MKQLLAALLITFAASAASAATISKYGNVLRIDGEIDYQTQHDFKKQFTNEVTEIVLKSYGCLLYTSPSPRDRTRSRMPSSA